VLKENSRNRRLKRMEEERSLVLDFRLKSVKWGSTKHSLVETTGGGGLSVAQWGVIPECSFLHSLTNLLS
jgi:hypothetical protein